MANWNYRSQLSLWLAFTVIVVTISVGGAKAARTDEVQSIAAIVNDDIISDYDLQQRMKLFARATNNMNPSPETAAKMRQEALKTLVDEHLELQEAKRHGVNVSDEQIDKAMQRLAQHNKMSIEQMKEFFASAGVDIKTLRSQVRAQITWNELIAQRFLPRINVSDEEVTTALQQIKRATNRPRLRIAEIVLHIDSPDQAEQVHQTAQSLVDQIRTGAQFPAVAHQYSQSASAAVGGDVGWVSAGQLEPAIEQALETMSPGQVSEPIRVNDTYTIIALIDQRSGEDTAQGGPGTQYSLRQLVIPAPADNQEAVEQALARAQELRNSLTSCAAMAEAPEAGNTLSGDLGTVSEQDLPPEFQKALAGLNKGDVAAPFTTQEGVHVLMVCGKTEPKPVEPTRELVEQRLTEDQLDMMARRYLRDLRRDAMIEYRIAEH